MLFAVLISCALIIHFGLAYLSLDLQALVTWATVFVPRAYEIWQVRFLLIFAFSHDEL